MSQILWSTYMYTSESRITHTSTIYWFNIFVVQPLDSYIGSLLHRMISEIELLSYCSIKFIINSHQQDALTCGPSSAAVDDY